MPPYTLVILPSHLSPPRLYNGIRLVIKRITGKLFEANILIVKFKGKILLLQQIPMIPSEPPISFERLQFLIRLAFTMTIIKSQSRAMSIWGLDLENPCFPHGQLYVTC
ncbi:ATP-dependent DNA helicase [Trichonephila inaurata madagascariensis]|uniref:ATP-dependent DNA helicase n=1 Tax=Trichonephila inaurata madagascariensis TaxID=2747483 RepID=A0A8X6YPW6_9ARAC|nr:ATP-dependent DNA helicase [Trichonephila inaurata madagascariensis]